MVGSGRSKFNMRVEGNCRGQCRPITNDAGILIGSGKLYRRHDRETQSLEAPGIFIKLPTRKSGTTFATLFSFFPCKIRRRKMRVSKWILGANCMKSRSRRQAVAAAAASCKLKCKYAVGRPTLRVVPLQRNERAPRTVGVDRRRRRLFIFQCSAGITCLCFVFTSPSRGRETPVVFHLRYLRSTIPGVMLHPGNN